MRQGLFIILALGAAAAMAQQADDGTFRMPRTGADAVSLPAPEAATLPAFRDYTVSYSTGTVQLAFPLYTVTAGELSLPLTLTHATGALNVDAESGFMGVAWELGCGGVVSRVVAGTPDALTDTHEAVTDDAGMTLERLERLKNLAIDNYLDRYSWQASGYSGTFVIKGDRVVQLPQTDCEIVRTPLGFVITTPEGVRYVYDKVEHVTYHYSPAMIEPNFVSPNYSDVPCQWRLTRIVNPAATDPIVLTYKSAPHSKGTRNMKTTTISATTDPTYISNTGKGGMHTQSLTTHSYDYADRNVPASITSRGATVVFDTDKVCYGFTVKAPDGSEVRRVKFDYVALNNRSGLQSLLKGYSVSADGEVVDGADFEYFDEGMPMEHADLLGHCNTVGEPYADFADDSVVDFKPRITSVTHIKPLTPDTGLGTGTIVGDSDNGAGNVDDGWRIEDDGDYSAKVSRSRRPRPQSALRNVLKKVTTCSGTSAEFEYEAAWADEQLTFGNRSDSVAVGLRVVRELVTDLATRDSINRRWQYSLPVCTIDFSRVGLTAFCGVSGRLDVAPVGLGVEYHTTGAVFTAVSRLPGESVESARMYHGRVTETMTGTGIEGALITDYEYDTSRVRAVKVIHPWQQGTVSDADRYNEERYAGRGEIGQIIGGTPREHQYFGAALDPNIIESYFRESLGERAPLLSCTHRRVNVDNTTTVLDRTRYTYHLSDSVTTPIGLYFEPVVRQKTHAGMAYDSFKYPSDFQYFPIEVSSWRVMRDSVIVDTYGDDGSSRRVATRYSYLRGTEIPAQVTTLCGDQQVTKTYTWAKTYRGSTPTLTARNLHQWTLPVSESMTVGSATVTTRYNYASMGRGVRLESRVIRTGAGALLDSLRIHTVDAWGNPTEVSRMGDAPQRYTWQHNGMYLRSATAGGLTTIYEYKPLIGCTSVKAPSRLTTRYGYRAGLLAWQTLEKDTIMTYQYRLFDRDSQAPAMIMQRSVGGGERAPDGVVRTYYDGFGRARVVRDAVGAVTVTACDALGRPLRQYVPVNVAGSDEWLPDIEAAVRNTAPSDTLYAASTYTGFDSRPRTLTMAGADMASHPAVTKVRYNTTPSILQPAWTDHSLNCKRWEVDANGRPKQNGYWPGGVLEVVTTTDAEGRAVSTFTDFRGRKVLERRILTEMNLGPELPLQPMAAGGKPGLTSDTFADTYYIYDDADNLLWVLPPMAVANPDDLDLYAWRYSYDAQWRMTEKKAPDAETVRYVYDSTNRLILTQDGEQRRRGRCGFTLCDDAGRECVSGECNWVEATVAQIGRNRVRVRPGSDYGNALGGYVCTFAQLPSPTADRVIYYDNYDWLDWSLFADIKESLDNALANDLQVSTRYNSTGLETGGWSRLLEDEDDTSEVLLPWGVNYDSYRRVFTHITQLPDGCRMKDTYNYNRRGAVKRHIGHAWQGKPGNTSYDLGYTLDAALRPTEVKSTFNSQLRSTEAIGYNAAGQVDNMRVNSLPPITTTYATRGAVTAISYPAWGMTLSYDRSGFINSQTWHQSDGVTRSYSYFYDTLGRLTQAQFDGSTTGHYSAAYTYNLNSSPLSIRRYGLSHVTDNATDQPTLTFGIIDDLTLSYNGNRLVKADDAASPLTYAGADDFDDLADESTEYEYDRNGRLTADLNRNISEIRYNRLGLPYRITIADNTTLTMLYAADGTMLSRTVKEPYTPTWQRSLGIDLGGTFTPDTLYPNPGDRPDLRAHTTTTTYYGQMEYRNGKFHRLNLDRGYVDADGRPRLYLRDHQGNIRAVIDAKNGQYTGALLQQTDYYPYGMPHGESLATALKSQNGATLQPYKYAGKEHLTTAGLNTYDYGQRLHSPTTATWNRQDRFAEKYYNVSPYSFCAADPINKIDLMGDSTFVYATCLPNTKLSIPKFIATYVSDFTATHTFVVVKDKDGNKVKFSYGSETNDIVSGRLCRKQYSDDYEAMKNGKEGDGHVKNIIAVPIPEGMSEEEFDEAVKQSAEEFGNNENITYHVLTNDVWTGNCNSSSYNLLRNAGVSKTVLNSIKDQLKGITWGWGQIRPWTQKEQQEAVKQKAIRDAYKNHIKISNGTLIP